MYVFIGIFLWLKIWWILIRNFSIVKFTFNSKYILTEGFPGGSDGKKVCLQCRRPRFDPRVGKIHWRRQWQPNPVFLSGEFHGQTSLVSHSPWGHKESATTQSLTLSWYYIYGSALGNFDISGCCMTVHLSTFMELNTKKVNFTLCNCLNKFYSM